MPESRRHRVLIADDHPLFRDALSTLISRDSEFEVVATVGSFGEAVAGATAADIAIVDIHMPDMPSPEGLARLREAAPVLLIVAVSGDVDPGVVRAAMDAGANGYVPKAFAADSILAALRLVVTGVPFTPPGTHLARPAEPASAQATPEAPLTPREMEVLRLLVKGATYKEIARALTLAEITVKLHVKRVVDKLGAKNRSEAIAKAVRSQLIVSD